MSEPRRVIPNNIGKLMSTDDQKKYGFRTVEAITEQQEIDREKDLHTMFMQFLHRHRLGYYHAPMFKKSELEKGVPDFGVYRGSRIIWIEFKVGKNKLDPDQKNKIATMLADDNEVRVCYNYSDATREVIKFFNLF
jgi:hypothetical protein